MAEAPSIVGTQQQQTQTSRRQLSEVSGDATIDEPMHDSIIPLGIENTLADDAHAPARLTEAKKKKNYQANDNNPYDNYQLQAQQQGVQQHSTDTSISNTSSVAAAAPTNIAFQQQLMQLSKQAEMLRNTSNCPTDGISVNSSLSHKASLIGAPKPSAPPKKPAMTAEEKKEIRADGSLTNLTSVVLKTTQVTALSARHLTNLQTCLNAFRKNNVRREGGVYISTELAKQVQSMAEDLLHNNIQSWTAWENRVATISIMLDKYTPPESSIWTKAEQRARNTFSVLISLVVRTTQQKALSENYKFTVYSSLRSFNEKHNLRPGGGLYISVLYTKQLQAMADDIISGNIWPWNDWEKRVEAFKQHIHKLKEQQYGQILMATIKDDGADDDYEYLVENCKRQLHLLKDLQRKTKQQLLTAGMNEQDMKKVTLHMDKRERRIKQKEQLLASYDKGDASTEQHVKQHVPTSNVNERKELTVQQIEKLKQRMPLLKEIVHWNHQAMVESHVDYRALHMMPMATLKMLLLLNRQILVLADNGWTQQALGFVHQQVKKLNEAIHKKKLPQASIGEDDDLGNNEADRQSGSDGGPISATHGEAFASTITMTVEESMEDTYAVEKSTSFAIIPEPLRRHKRELQSELSQTKEKQQRLSQSESVFLRSNIVRSPSPEEPGEIVTHDELVKRRREADRREITQLKNATAQIDHQHAAQKKWLTETEQALQRVEGELNKKKQLAAKVDQDIVVLRKRRVVVQDLIAKQMCQLIEARKKLHDHNSKQSEHQLGLTC